MKILIRCSSYTVEKNPLKTNLTVCNKDAYFATEIVHENSEYILRKRIFSIEIVHENN